MWNLPSVPPPLFASPHVWCGNFTLAPAGGQGGRGDPEPHKAQQPSLSGHLLVAFAKLDPSLTLSVSLDGWAVYLGIADVNIFGGLSGGDAAANILPGVTGKEGSQAPPGDKHMLHVPVFGWRALPSVEPWPPRPEAIRFPLSGGVHFQPWQG